ncbi:MAG TPA: transcriptional regulator MraZ [Maritimibacter sp.]|nr:transcriptional regulator MraZ [Maritimibacter sp.]
MAQVFRGSGLHKVDAKGRVSIPALFRRVLEATDPDWTEGLAANFVIVFGDHRRQYLECYSMEAISEVDDIIASKPRGSKGRKLLENMYYGQSLPTSVDDTGRIVLPARLREKIGLDKEAYFVAAGDTFQIWNPETYDKVEAAKNAEYLDELPDDYDVAALLDEEPAE